MSDRPSLTPRRRDSAALPTPPFDWTHPFVQKLLLLPLRLLVGWSLSPRILGLLGVTMLVLLRVSIGWHFYSEGVDKRASGTWSAAPFFANARGPLAEQYRSMVWDYDGTLRLDREETMTNFALFRDDIIDHYGFSEQQKAEAQTNYANAVAQYDWVLADHAADLEEYIAGRDRMKELDTDEAEKAIRDGVSSLGGQRDTIRREWTQKAAPALKQIDRIWANYEVAQNALATPEQASVNPRLRLVKPANQVDFLPELPEPYEWTLDTDVIDKIVPYFDIVLGLCLLFGLFTPAAALAGAGFLGSVFLSQYPPASGVGSTYYQLIECMGCLVLAATGAGRFAGIDYFLHLIVRKVWGDNQPSTAA